MNSSILLLSVLSTCTALAMEKPYLRIKPGCSPPYYYVENCDKEGAAVAACIADATFGASETRTLLINPDANLIDAAFFERRGTETFDHYQRALVDSKNIVMSSVVETGLYIARVLHGLVLPSQWIGFADTWKRVVSAPGTKIAMWDYDARNDRFWVWCKMTKLSDVPSAYLKMLHSCDNLFIVRSTETEDPGAYVGRYNEDCYVHKSARATRHLAAIVDSLKLTPLSDEERIALRQHEWGSPDETLRMLQTLWKTLGKSVAKFHVIEGGTVPLLCSIPTLWERYLSQNERRIDGITINGYFVAHPTYERRYNLIPFHFYRWSHAANGWFPYNKLLLETVKRHWKNDRPFIVTVFANNIGSGIGANSDVNAICAFLNENHLGPQNANVNSFFSVGVDCTGAQCRSVQGEPLDDIPSTKVLKWLQERPDTTADRAMKPLPVAMVLALMRELCYP